MMKKEERSRKGYTSDCVINSLQKSKEDGRPERNVMREHQKSEETMIGTWSCGSVWCTALYISEPGAFMSFTNSVAMEPATWEKYSNLPNYDDLVRKYIIFQSAQTERILTSHYPLGNILLGEDQFFQNVYTVYTVLLSLQCCILCRIQAKALVSAQTLTQLWLC